MSGAIAQLSTILNDLVATTNGGESARPRSQRRGRTREWSLPRRRRSDCAFRYPVEGRWRARAAHRACLSTASGRHVNLGIWPTAPDAVVCCLLRSVGRGQTRSPRSSNTAHTARQPCTQIDAENAPRDASFRNHVCDVIGRLSAIVLLLGGWTLCAIAVGEVLVPVSLFRLVVTRARAQTLNDSQRLAGIPSNAAVLIPL